jgi:hypothetical protein
VKGEDYMAKENNKIQYKVIKEVPEEVYRESIGTDTEKVALVKRVEKIVRSSGEYRDYTFFLRKNMNMDACAFFNNVSKANSSKVRVEIHHAPLTLFDIAWIILEKHIEEGEEIDDLVIAEEVAEAHYDNMVGLIPLSKTLHELAHAKDGEPMVIPLYMVYGNYLEFLKQYKPYWENNEVIKAKLDNFVKQTEAIKNTDFDMLQEEFTYLKVDGFEIPVRIDDVGEEVAEALSA